MKEKAAHFPLRAPLCPSHASHSRETLMTSTSAPSTAGARTAAEGGPRGPRGAASGDPGPAPRTAPRGSAGAGARPGHCGPFRPPRSQPMGRLVPPAAMATGRLLGGAQNRCHMGHVGSVGVGSAAGAPGEGGASELNGPTRGSKSHFEVSAER